MANILLVVDPQNDFITGVLGSKYAQSIVPKIVEKINKFVGTVYVTVDEHGSEYPHSKEGSYVPNHCAFGTEGIQINSEINSAIKEHGNYKKLGKAWFALPEYETHWIVRDMENADELGTITIVGYATDICVITNALALNRYKGRVEVDASCCAGTSKEAHDAALTVMRSCLIDVI